MSVQGGRHYERFELNRPCRASRNGTARAATLSDISGSGARLKFINRPCASTNPFMAGNRLDLEIERVDFGQPASHLADACRELLTHWERSGPPVAGRIMP